jgi:hypothetical protein
MAGEVAPRQLGQRPVPVEGGRRRNDLIDQRVRLRLAHQSAGGYDQLELGGHEQRDGLDLAAHDALRDDEFCQLLAVQSVATLERASHGVDTARDGGVRRPDHARRRLAVAHDARPRQRQHPADIGGQDEVPRGTKDVCPQNGRAGEQGVDIRVDQPAHAESE